MSPSAIETVVRGEVRSAFAMRGCGGALEEADLWQVARIAAWQWESLGPAANAALLRVEVRRAVRNALRGEFRAQGRTHQQVLWPVYWPRDTQRARYVYRRPTVIRRYCRDCGAFVERRTVRRCAKCNRLRRLEQQRVYNAAYWRRQHPQAAA